MCGSVRVIKENWKAEGKFETALKLFLDESISAEKAAETLDMTVEQFLAKAKVQMS